MCQLLTNLPQELHFGRNSNSQGGRAHDPPGIGVAVGPGPCPGRKGVSISALGLRPAGWLRHPGAGSRTADVGGQLSAGESLLAHRRPPGAKFADSSSVLGRPDLATAPPATGGDGEGPEEGRAGGSPPLGSRRDPEREPGLPAIAADRDEGLCLFHDQPGRPDPDLEPDGGTPVRPPRRGDPWPVRRPAVAAAGPLLRLAGPASSPEGLRDEIRGQLLDGPQGWLDLLGRTCPFLRWVPRRAK